MIYGSNFGTDTSLIRVYINGKPAPVIASTGSSIYVLVPSKAGTGEVKVIIGDHSTAQETEAPVEFKYIFYPLRKYVRRLYRQRRQNRHCWRSHQ